MAASGLHAVCGEWFPDLPTHAAGCHFPVCLAQLRSEPCICQDYIDGRHAHARSLWPEALILCDGCRVQRPFEHRCHGEHSAIMGEQTGRRCECRECLEFKTRCGLATCACAWLTFVKAR